MNEPSEIQWGAPPPPERKTGGAIHLFVFISIVVAAAGLWWWQRPNAAPPESASSTSNRTDQVTSPPTTTAPTAPSVPRLEPPPEAPTSDTPAATTTVEIPPAPIEWANFTYEGIGCGVAEDVTLVNGEDSTLAPDQFATLVGVSTLTDGNVVVDFSCLVGPTGRGGTESLLLYTAGGQLLDRFDLGVYASATISADGTGIIEFSELADSDPMCCPSILKQSTLRIENGRFIVSEPTLVQL